MVDGIYGFQWMDNQAAPDEILELVACDCKKEKCIEQCQCVLLQIPCTDVCKCESKCHNEVPESFFIPDEVMKILNGKKHISYIYIYIYYTYICIYCVKRE